MMKYIIIVLFIFALSTVAFGAAGTPVLYEVEGKSYEGYYISPDARAPLVFLIRMA